MSQIESELHIQNPLGMMIKKSILVTVKMKSMQPSKTVRFDHQSDPLCADCSLEFFVSVTFLMVRQALSAETEEK